jgi:hypothetical protein
MTVISRSGRAGPATGNSELLRALGAIALSPPPESDVLCRAAGLPPMTGEEHTAAFILGAPPYAAIHLGAEGKLGGEGLDRVEGFWRASGQQPPSEADHLGVLLMSYAWLREAAAGTATARAAEVLFHEHIWSFTPGYLTAVADLALPPVTAWAELTLQVLRAEQAALPPSAGPHALPLALRSAPAPLGLADGFDEILDAAVTPVRSGIILTQTELAAGAAAIGLGYRRGERRYALRAMIEQDKASTLCWLSALAARWADRHAGAYGPTLAGQWWSERATHSSATLMAMAQEAS